MHTKAEMLEEIRYLALDSTDANWSSDTRPLAMLQKAAAFLWRYMVKDPKAHRILQQVTVPKAFVSNVNTYAYPSSCMLVKKLQVRQYDTLYAQLTCGTAGETDETQWPNDAEFRIVADGVTTDVTGVDLSGEASMTAVAAAIQVALRAATGGTETVTYDTDNDTFIVKSYINIAPLEAVPDGTGTDISSSSYMNGRYDGTGMSIAIQTTLNDFADIRADDYDEVAGPSWTPAVTAAYTTGIANHGLPEYWTDEHAPDGYFRVKPTPLSPPGMYRLWYLREPSFPSGDTDTFTGLPEGIDTCLEYLAASYLLMEEIENDVPIGTWGQMFLTEYSNLIGAEGHGKAKPDRPRIRRLRRRR